MTLEEKIDLLANFLGVDFEENSCGQIVGKFFQRTNQDINVLKTEWLQLKELIGVWQNDSPSSSQLSFNDTSPFRDIRRTLIKQYSQLEDELRVIRVRIENLDKLGEDYVSR